MLMRQRVCTLCMTLQWICAVTRKFILTFHPLRYLFYFLYTCTCVSIHRSTTSSGWKSLIFVYFVTKRLQIMVLKHLGYRCISISCIIKQIKNDYYRGQLKSHNPKMIYYHCYYLLLFLTLKAVSTHIKVH